MIIADLHLHSRYSRACSKDLTIPNLEKHGRIKGLGLMGTSDFTHPLWLKELKQHLVEDGSGILRTKTGFPFILQTEVSNLYPQDGKGRRVHNIILAKSFEVVEQINEHLSKKGKLASDGRPMFGRYACCDMVEDLKRIDKDIEIIPAHIWTPWFSVFGSESGFDSLQDCFRDQTKHIHALETGLSSDPAMNWRLSMLDKYTLVSNSDSHSYWPWRIGREANAFDLEDKELSYDRIMNILKTREKFLFTIEVDPSYGKYHFDGHRVCNVCMSPKESIKNKDICPKCGKRLTIGVLHRVEELADRPEGFALKGAVPFKSMIPLSEIISTNMGVGIATQKTKKIVSSLMERFESEFNVLLNASFEELKKTVDEKLAELIIKNREGKIYVKPGYDGEYGIPVFDDEGIKQAKIDSNNTFSAKHKQMSLGDF